MIESETATLSESVPLLIGPEEIHHSIADAGDMEEVWDERIWDTLK
jgi:hypothetical protein